MTGCASCACELPQARKEFWQNEACAFPDGCYVPTKLHSSVTVGDLKRAGLELGDLATAQAAGVCGRGSAPPAFTDLTALDITILRKDVEGTKYLLQKLKPDMELTFSANITRALVLISKHLPYHIGSALEILEKTDEGGPEIFRKLRDVSRLTQILTKNEVRGITPAKGFDVHYHMHQKWKGFESDSNDSPTVECNCSMQLLGLSGIAAAPLEVTFDPTKHGATPSPVVIVFLTILSGPTPSPFCLWQPLPSPSSVILPSFAIIVWLTHTF